MRVLILGGTGYIGTRLAALMRADGRDTPVVAARHSGPRVLQLDTRDARALVDALRQVDAVVNAVAGSAGAIAQGARALAGAVRHAGPVRVVHLSSQAIYGPREGLVHEQSPPDPRGGWYARAKRVAEAQMAQLAAQGTPVTVLRPGCVWGPGSHLWVGRIAQWLDSGRLGDLGARGDGWTNGVHVDDVAQAVLQALREMPAPQGLRVFNLAAPDSPRWNDWFTDLGLAIGAVPLRRLGPWPLRLQAWCAGPWLHAAQRLRLALGRAPGGAQPLSPGLLDLWQRQLRLDASAASRDLGLAWTAYPVSLQQAAAWWRGQRGETWLG